ncbi:MAG: hypothetical protein HZB40_20250, partial [Rhodocyclales bacterium]|nr:hypothetical protein [Rhodocyclales bacterium]
MADLQLSADILNSTPEPAYPKKADGTPDRTLSRFANSERGLALSGLYGEIRLSGGGFQADGWPLRPDAAAMDRLGGVKMGELEGSLTSALNRAKLGDVQVTGSQRAAMLSMAWNNRVTSAVEVARAIAAGKSARELCEIASKTAPSASRANLECEGLSNGEIQEIRRVRGKLKTSEFNADGMVDDLVPISSTQTASSGGTAESDAEAAVNALLRQRIRQALEKIKEDHPEEEFEVSSDGERLFLQNGHSRFTIESDGTVTEARDSDADRADDSRDMPDQMEEAREDATEDSSSPQTRRDPLVLDLNGNGIATTDVSHFRVFFDHDANQLSEATGWIDTGDAFLAWDRNANGLIDNGSELFGDQTLLRSGAKAASGLQALAEWDSNRDGKIDANDARLADLRVWQDANQDGVSQADELKTLGEAGIAAINLASTATSAAPDATGNTLTRRGSFVRSDGSTGLAAEIAFRRDTALSIPVANYTVTETIAAQPDLSGYGNLLDLHQALAKEDATITAGGGTPGSGPLAIALNNYLAAAAEVGAGNTAIPTPRDLALDQLLYTWANTQGLNPSSRGGAMDARKIAFLETAFGQCLGNPDSNAAVQWNMSWQQVREYYNASLLAQTRLKPLFDEIQYTWDDTSQTLKADLTAVESLLQDSLATDPIAGTVQLADFARAIKGLGAEDSVNYLALRETFIEHDQQNGTELAWAMDSAGMQVYD